MIKNQVDILGLIDSHSINQPFCCALQDERKQVSYSELKLWSNNIAHLLKQMGIGKSSKVAIILPGNSDFFLIAIAILKSGAAFVPIDPAYPLERKKHILSDMNPSLIITLKDGISELKALSQANILCINDFETLINFKDCPEPLHREISNDLAYVIYTSGSTGVPKGVMIGYDSLCNVCSTVIEVLPLNSESRFLQFASIGFDASILDWMATLTQGASLYCFSSNQLKFDLRKLMNDLKITITVLPPTVAALLQPSQFPFLNTLIVAGEICSEQVVTLWKKNVRFLNFYGPTEATIWSTYFQHNADSSYPSETIGKTIKGVTAYVVNDENKICNEGEIGELLLEGNTLAQGYLNLPHVTVKKFVFLPEISRNRLYRTGDLVYKLSDESLVYVSRNDRQIKIHGNRVELQEIEKNLQMHPEVALAVVEYYPTLKKIVAYIQKKEKTTFLTSDQILEYLQSRLPSFMIPSKLLLIDLIPLNIHGKIDRSKLLSFFENQKQEDNVSESISKDNLENTLHDIFKRLLDLSHINYRMSFIKLGLDSLGAISAISEIEDKINFRLDLYSLYKHHSIKKLTCYIKSVQKEQFSRCLLHFKKSNSEKSLFFIPPIEGFSFPYFSLKSYLKNVNLYSIDLAPNLGKKITNLSELCEQYVDLLNYYCCTRECTLSGWGFGSIIAYEIGSQLIKKYNKNVKLILVDDQFFSEKKEYGFLNERILDIYQINPNSQVGKKFYQQSLENDMLVSNYILKRKMEVKVHLITSKSNLNAENLSHNNPQSFRNLNIESLPIFSHEIFLEQNIPTIANIFQKLIK